MTYDEAIEFWFGRINYEVKSPRPRDLSLDRIRQLLDLLGNPQERFRIVHVAGSKGKGSTSAMLASILGRAAYRTGLFTSPHLCRVEERIQVDGRAITAEELTVLLNGIAALVNPTESSDLVHHSPLTPTFFAAATALAFRHLVR